jgi:hypothetical protein
LWQEWSDHRKLVLSLNNQLNLLASVLGGWQVTFCPNQRRRKCIVHAFFVAIFFTLIGCSVVHYTTGMADEPFAGSCSLQLTVLLFGQSFPNGSSFLDIALKA